MTKTRRPSPQQRRILRRLTVAPDTRPADLARLIRVSPQRMSQHLDMLAHHGWLDRGAHRLTVAGVEAGR